MACGQCQLSGDVDDGCHDEGDEDEGGVDGYGVDVGDWDDDQCMLP